MNFLCCIDLINFLHCRDLLPCTLGLTLRKVKTVIAKNRYYWLLRSQILWEIYIWPNFCRIFAFSLRNSYVKNVQFGKNFKFSWFSFIDLLYFMHINKIWSKIPGIFNPDFSRIFRIRFFSRKKRVREVAGGCGRSIFSPIFYQYIYISYFILIYLVAEAGRYEKCKKLVFYTVAIYKFTLISFP